ncbi:WXG100 family type VII secretion target [Actinokineospora sp.]|uniref:WXG100 family type VII secretion target n=1 Tax=Actinokineospora sp. TaxID=1872133 RepID=UPI004037C95E
MTNPLVAERQDSTKVYSGIGVAESALDLYNGVRDGSWIEGGLGLAGTGLEAFSLKVDPLGRLGQYAVSWVIEQVKPLRDALNWLAGDADQIAAYAQSWKNAAKAVGGVAEGLKTEVANGTSGWTGPAADAYRRNTAEQGDYITAVGRGADTVGTVVEVVGVLVGVVRGFVRDLVAECVSTLVVRIPQWLAEAGVTLGSATPHIVASVGSLVALWAERIAEVIAKLTRSLAKLSPMLTKLGELWVSITSGLEKLRAGTRTATPNALDSVHTMSAAPGDTATSGARPQAGTETAPSSAQGDVPTPPEGAGGPTPGLSTASRGGEHWLQSVGGKLTPKEFTEFKGAMAKLSADPVPGQVPGSGQLTPHERDLMARAMKEVDITGGTVMQKVLPEAAVAKYLDGTNSPEVGGFVARQQDAGALRTPADLISGNRLDYPNSPYSASQSHISVMEFPAGDPSLYKTPVGAPAVPGTLPSDSPAVLHARDEMVAAAERAGVDPRTYTPTINEWPYTGAGVTGHPTKGVPEFVLTERVPIPEGATISRYDTGGNKVLVATYDRVLGWVKP